MPDSNITAANPNGCPLDELGQLQPEHAPEAVVRLGDERRFRLSAGEIKFLQILGFAQTKNSAGDTLH